MEPKTTDSSAPASFAYGEYKQEDEQIESPAGSAVLTRPARVFTPEEEAKLYRKVRLATGGFLAPTDWCDLHAD